MHLTVPTRVLCICHLSHYNTREPSKRYPRTQNLWFKAAPRVCHYCLQRDWKTEDQLPPFQDDTQWSILYIQNFRPAIWPTLDGMQWGNHDISLKKTSSTAYFKVKRNHDYRPLPVLWGYCCNLDLRMNGSTRMYFGMCSRVLDSGYYEYTAFWKCW